MSDTSNDIDALAGFLTLASIGSYASIPSRVAANYRTALTALVAERDALKNQRDEAREEICELVAESVETITGFTTTAKQIAARRGWDCYGQGGGA